MQRARQNLGLVFGSILVAYAILEAFFLISGFVPYRKRLPGNFDVLLYDPFVGWINRPRFEEPGVFKIDSAGFRVIQGAPESPRKTIVCIGDSGTFGIWDRGDLPLQFDSYPEKLQQLLPGDFKVINAGVIGHTSSQALRNYMLRVRKLKPDYLLIRIGFNDHSTPQDPRLRVPEPASSLGRLMVYRMNRTFAVQTVTQLRFSLFRDETRQRIPWNTVSEYRFNLERLVQYAREDGVQPVLFDYPIRPAAYPGRPDSKTFPEFWGVTSYEGLLNLHADYVKTMLDVSSTLNVPLIKSAPLLEAPTSAAFVSTDIVHPNAKGYALLGAIARDFIVEFDRSKKTDR